MDSYTLFILKNISIISLPTMVLSLFFLFFFLKDKTNYSNSNIGHHIIINKKVAIPLFLYFLVSLVAIWAKITCLEYVILFLNFVFFYVFSAVLPIANRPILFIDVGWFINGIMLTLNYLLILIGKDSIRELSTNSLEQVKYIGYLLAFCFIVIYLSLLCCNYMIKLLKKKPIFTKSDVSMYIISKVSLIISVFLTYVVIIHDNYNEKVIEFYTFVAETLVIPIILLLFSSIKKK